MKINIFALFIFYILIGPFSTAYSQNCETGGDNEYILPNVKETVAFNQDGLGICTASAIATQMQMFNIKDISLMHASVAYANTQDHKIKNKMENENSKIYFEGAPICDLFNTLKDTGYCLASESPMEQLFTKGILTSEEYENLTKAIAYIFQANDSKVKNEVKSAITALYNKVKSCRTEDLFCDTPEIMHAISEELAEQFNKKPEKLKDIFSKNKFKENFKKKKTIDHLNDFIAQNRSSVNALKHMKDTSKNKKIIRQLNELIEKISDFQRALNEKIMKINDSCEENCLESLQKNLDKQPPIFSSIQNMHYSENNKLLDSIDKSIDELSSEHNSYRAISNINIIKKIEKKKNTQTQIDHLTLFYKNLDIGTLITNFGDQFENDLEDNIKQIAASITSNQILNSLIIPDDMVQKQACNTLKDNIKSNFESNAGADNFIQNVSSDSFPSFASIYAKNFEKYIKPNEIIKNGSLENLFISNANRAYQQKHCFNIKDKSIKSSCSTNSASGRAAETIIGILHKLNSDGLDAILGAWNEKPYTEQIATLFGPNCNKENRKKFEHPKNCFSNPIENNTKAKNETVAEVFKQINSSKPVGLLICGSFLYSNLSSITNLKQEVLDSSEECGNHAVSIVGQRCVKGVQQFLMRNSWGADCSPYELDLSKNEECNPSTGDVWYTADNIIKISKRYYTYD